MKNKRMLVLILILGLITIGIGVGIAMWNKPHAKVENAEGIKISATELSAAYMTDENAANAKYLNKALEVTGTVGTSTQNQDGATVVSLHGDTDDATVQCTMRDKGATPIAGEKITMKGFCSGNTMFDVLLTDCIVK